MGWWHFVETWWFWIDWGCFAAALVSVPSVLIRRRGRPMSAVSWILGMLSLPFVGLVLWWLIGRSHLERRKRRKQHAHERMQRRLADVAGRLDEPPSHRPALLQVANIPAEMASSVFRPSTGNAVELIDSHEAFDVMEAAIRGAKHHVHALFYIWKNDATGRRFRELLEEKAKEGVEVRVLIDAIGSPVWNTRFARPLRKAGAQVHRFLPPRWFSRAPRLNFRNHRKILVVDGKTGFIGGFNMADEYRTEWRDFGIKIEGPAVDQLQEIFADDWYYASDEDLADIDYFGGWTSTKRGHGAACATVASGPDTHLSPIHDAIFMAMNAAKERIFVMTPYFIPTRALVAAIRAAVYRGVDVRIMLPAKNDVMLVQWAARSYYAELLDVGVRVFEYQPTMHHAKVVLFDDRLTMIGSANLDSRSFRLNFEASCFVGSVDLNATLAEEFEKDLTNSLEITKTDVDALPWTYQLGSAAAHLLSPLL
jgi:cardiolipin synthase A/B